MMGILVMLVFGIGQGTYSFDFGAKIGLLAQKDDNADHGVGLCSSPVTKIRKGMEV